VVVHAKSLSYAISQWFGTKIYSHNKCIPTFIWNTDYAFKKSFIEGFYDGDGCKRLYDESWRLTSSSKILLVEMQHLLMSMGHFSSLCQGRKPCVMKIQGRECNTHGLWELNINFGGHIKQQYREDDEFFYVPVKNIKIYPYNGLVYNFTTSSQIKSDNHTYCADNICFFNCDGDIWHANQEQAENDKQRDSLLAQRGWTVLRFDDKVIEEARQAVHNTIGEYIGKAMKTGKQKTASKPEPVLPILHTLRRGKVQQMSDYASYLGRFYKAGLKQDIGRLK